MADTANNLCIAHKSVTLKAQKKAHSEDERSERSVVLCFFAMFCFCFSSFANEASDIASIKQDVQMLRTLINNQSIAFYNWDAGVDQLTSGTQQAIAFTLRNIAIGLHDSILPSIFRLSDNITNQTEIIQSIDDNLDKIYLNVSNIEHIADAINSILYDVVGLLQSIATDIPQGFSDLYNELVSFRQIFEQYKDLALTYLKSIDNNVGVIAELQ